MILKLLSVTNAVNIRNLNDDIYELILSDGTVRSPLPDEITAAKRLQLRDDINAERERREALGLNYLFPDGQYGIIQMRNATDFRNITGQTTKATIMTMQGVADPVLWFTDAGNVRHPFTPAEMLLLGAAVQQRISDLYAAASEIKTSMAIADPDTFDITAGWPD